MASVIDQLPEAQRKKVVDALLAGQSLRKVAKMAGVSHVQVGEYRRKVLLPAIQSAQKINALKAIAETPAEQAEAITTLTRAAIQADPLVARIQQHQATIDAKLTDTDARGAAALISADLRGIELHAKLTGRLDSAAINQTNIQIVCPAGQAEPAVTVEPDAVVIDIGGRK